MLMKSTFFVFAFLYNLLYFCNEGMLKMTLYLNFLEKNINSRSPNQVILGNQGIPINQEYKGKARPATVRVTSEAVINCENNSLQANTLKKGVVAKIPVILAELTVEFNVNSEIDLHMPIYQIHNTKKQLKLTKCVLLQSTNMLFIEGYVKNTIEYYTNAWSDWRSTCGNLKYCTVDIPFRCSTAIFFNGTQPAEVIPNRVNEIEFRVQQSASDLICQEYPDDFTQFNQISTSFYNELPFCELVSSKVVEMDEIKKSIFPFTVIEEKLVVCIMLKLLQYRKVAIPPGK